MSSNYSWTQPCCQRCWDDLHIFPAHRLTPPEEERCVHCGEDTQDGIYIRIDPDTARFPSRLKEAS